MPTQATPQAADEAPAQTANAASPNAPQASAPASDAAQTVTQTSVAIPENATAAEVYQALRAQRRELINQREALEDTRNELRQQLRQGTLSDADRAGLDQRIALTDQQIVAKQIAIAESEAQVATAAAVPGAAVEPPRQSNDDAGEILAIGFVVMTFLAIPVVLAWTRRLWRKNSTVVKLPGELTDRLGNLERSVDSVAVEVERIGEGQRFVTQLLAERAASTGRLAAAVEDRQL